MYTVIMTCIISINTKMYIFFKKLGERIFGADAFCRAHPPAAPGVSMKRLMNAAAPTGPSGSATFSKKMPGKGNNAGAVAAGLKHRISQDSGRQGSSNSASIGTNSSGFLNTSNDAVFDYMAEVMFSVDPGDYKVTDGIENEVAAAVDGDFLGPQQEGLITSAVNFNSMLQLYPTAESYVADKSDVIELFIERLSGDDKYVLDRMKDFGGELEGDTVAEIERIRNRSRQISTKLGIWFRKLGVAAYGEDVFNQVYRDVQMPLQRGRPLKKRMHKEVQLTDADEDNADDNERPIDISKFIGIAEYQAAADDHTVSTLQRHQNGHVEASDAGQTAVVGNIRSIFEDMDGSSYERARSSIDFGLLRKLYPSARNYYASKRTILKALLDRLPVEEPHTGSSSAVADIVREAKLIVWFNKLGRDVYGEAEFNKYLYAVEPPAKYGYIDTATDGSNGIQNPRIRYVHTPSSIISFSPRELDDNEDLSGIPSVDLGDLAGVAIRAVYPTTESYISAQHQIMRGFIGQLSKMEQHLLLSVFTPQQVLSLDLDEATAKESVRQIHSKLVEWFRTLGIAVYGPQAFSNFAKDVIPAQETTLHDTRVTPILVDIDVGDDNSVSQKKRKAVATTSTNNASKKKTGSR
jgi:hypothetical protein